MTDTRVHTDVKEIGTTLRAIRVCDAEVNKLQVLGTLVSERKKSSGIATMV